MSRPRCSELLLLLLLAAGAAAAPAGGRGEALGSVGRFPSNSRPRARPAIRTSGAPLPRGRSRTTAPPPLASLAFLASSRGAPQSAPAARVLDGGTPEPHTGGQKDEGTKLPPREAGLLHPRGTSPPVLAAVRSTPGQAGSCYASLCVRGRRRGLLGCCRSRFPQLLAPRASSLASQDIAVLTLPVAQLTRLQSCN